MRAFCPEASSSRELADAIVDRATAGGCSVFEAQVIIAMLADLGARPGFTLQSIDAHFYFGLLNDAASRTGGPAA